MAVENVFDATTSWVADIDPGPRKILAHRYPGVPNLGDVTRVDWSQVEPVDIIAGGSPCQEVSLAGRRAGFTEGTRSNLWSAMREAIAVICPKIVVWENVRGAMSAAADSALESCPRCVGDPRDRGPVLRALGRVLGDLADLGFDAEWHGLRAADIGACHGRWRVFVVAYPRGDSWRIEHRSGQAVADPNNAGRSEQRRPVAARSEHRAAQRSPTEDGLKLPPTPRATDGTKGGPNQRGSSGDLMLPSAVMRLLPTPGANLGHNGGPQDPDKRRAGGHSVSIEDAVHGLLTSQSSWGDYAPAIHRHELALGRVAPSPVEVGPSGKPRLSAVAVEWMMGLPDGWVTDTPGITRNEALKALGNGVVPQQCEAALEHMLNRVEAA